MILKPCYCSQKNLPKGTLFYVWNDASYHLLLMNANDPRLPSQKRFYYILSKDVSDEIRAALRGLGDGASMVQEFDPNQHVLEPCCGSVSSTPSSLRFPLLRKCGTAFAMCTMLGLIWYRGGCPLPGTVNVQELLPFHLDNSKADIHL